MYAHSGAHAAAAMLPIAILTVATYYFCTVSEFARRIRTVETCSADTISFAASEQRKPSPNGTGSRNLAHRLVV